jgi:phosphopantothenoylcysteine decarboxylase/phosphopantothenate--cysteine ligase
MFKVTLGVSSSIAVYKACEVARRLMEKGCSVRVIMTANAAKLVSPTVFEALTGNPAAVELFAERSARSIEHIELARWEDLLVIAPATANSIGKFANGIADDFLSTHFLASGVPCLIAPAMNGRMWRAPALQANIATLEKRGAVILAPKKGVLACGEEDIGALEDPGVIVEEALSLIRTKDLRGKKVIVTAGPTREYLDPVRFISNPSSGKMGYEIADTAQKRGAKVTLISGPSALTSPRNVDLIKVTTTEEMFSAVKKLSAGCDFLFMAAAPSDFAPKERSAGKRARKNGSFKIELVPTEDILKRISSGKRKKQVFCGFAAETDKHIEKAKSKLKDKGADLIALNDVSRKDIGFGSDENEMTIIWADGKTERLNKAFKRELADKLLDSVVKKLKHEK